MSTLAAALAGTALAISPADRMDIACIQTATWLAAQDAKAGKPQTTARMMTIFFMGRLSGRSPSVQWVQVLDRELPTTSRSGSDHLRTMEQCMPIMREVLRVPD